MSKDWYQRKIGAKAANSPVSWAPRPSSHAQPTAPAAAPSYASPSPQAPPSSLSEALASPHTKTRGGDAARAGSKHCPSCSSGNFVVSPKMEGAKPHCFDCGFPVVQFGSETGEGAAMQAMRG